MWPAAHTQSLGLPLLNERSEHKRCTGCTNAVSGCGCLQGSPCGTVNGANKLIPAMNGGWMDGWIQTRSTGRQCSPVMRLPPWQSLQHARWSDEANNGARAASAGLCCGCRQGSPCSLRDDPGAHGNERGWGGCKTEQGQQAWVMAKVGRQGMAKQGRCSKQPADEVVGTGLVANIAGR